MIRLVLDDLLKRYDGVPVIDGISLEVPPGELTFLLGPVGAGKSTLARLIAGLEKPDRGEIFFDSRAIRELPTSERKVGLTFADDALWPHLSVADNVGYPLKVRGLPRRQRRARVVETLGTLRIDSLIDLKPSSLTNSQRRRVALARAIITDPDLLVLDQPLAHLEGRARDEIRDEIRRLHFELETTMLVLTDEPREALSTADRIAVLDLGRIVQIGSPVEVYNRPADPFVAQFLGPVNLLQGHFDSIDARGDAIVRTPIGRLVGRAPDSPPPPGQPVAVVIRPESLNLGPHVPASSNRFSATVERQVFLGELRQVFLRAQGDWLIQGLTLQGLGQQLRQGSSITVSVPPELVVILPSKHAAAGPRPIALPDASEAST